MASLIVCLFNSLKLAGFSQIVKKFLDYIFFLIKCLTKFARIIIFACCFNIGTYGYYYYRNHFSD